MRQAWVVAAKELVDLSRDRRALLLGFLLPVVAVPGFSVLVEGGTLDRLNSPARVAVVGPRSADLLRSGQGLLEAVAVQDPEQALRSGRVAAVVELRVDADRVVEVAVRYRARDLQGLAAREKVAQAVARYSLPFVDRTLASRGLDREALTPVRLRDEPVPGGSGWFGDLVPLVLVVWSFAGASLVAADLTAGEKERGTWDILRCAPVRRMNLLGGKFVASWVAGTTLAILAASAQLAVVGLGSVGALQAAALGVAAVATSAVAAGLALLVGLVSRGVREANQWSLPVYLGVLGAAASARTLEGWPLAPAFPVLGPMLLASRAAAGGLPDPLEVVWTVGSSAFLCTGLLLASTLLVDRD